MRSAARRCELAILTVALLLGPFLQGSLAARSLEANVPEDPCEELAFLFYVAAKYEARGEPKGLQLAWMRDNYQGGGSEPTALFQRALDFIYASDLSPWQIHAAVKNHCTVNERGQVVVLLPGL